MLCATRRRVAVTRDAVGSASLAGKGNAVKPGRSELSGRFNLSFISHKPLFLRLTTVCNVILSIHTLVAESLYRSLISSAA